jgi:hypothetical protein
MQGIVGFSHRYRLAQHSCFGVEKILYNNDYIYSILLARYTTPMHQEPTDGVSIHAGFPNPAADKSFDSLDLHQLLIPRPTSTFLFRVAGSQWQDVGIFDGDIAVIDRALDPRKTDTVIWWDEAKGDFQATAFTALPTGAAVWGVVTATVHQLRK